MESMRKRTDDVSGELGYDERKSRSTECGPEPDVNGMQMAVSNSTRECTGTRAVELYSPARVIRFNLLGISTIGRSDLQSKTGDQCLFYLDRRARTGRRVVASRWCHLWCISWLLENGEPCAISRALVPTELGSSGHDQCR